MKKIIAITAILASAQASAFWGFDNSSTQSDGNYTGAANGAADASAEAEATFSMSFTGKGKTSGNFAGNSNNGSNWSGYGYDAPYYYGPYGAPVAPQAPAVAQ